MTTTTETSKKILERRVSPKRVLPPMQEPARDSPLPDLAATLRVHGYIVNKIIGDKFFKPCIAEVQSANGAVFYVHLPPNTYNRNNVINGLHDSLETTSPVAGLAVVVEDRDKLFIPHLQQEIQLNNEHPRILPIIECDLLIQNPNEAKKLINAIYNGIHEEIRKQDVEKLRIQTQLVTSLFTAIQRYNQWHQNILNQPRTWEQDSVRHHSVEKVVENQEDLAQLLLTIQGELNAKMGK